jgi:hypothetical protein
MTFRFTSTAAIVLALATPVVAFDAVFVFGYVLRNADQVIVGHVTNVTPDAEDRPFIEAEVLETWRGQSLDHIRVNVTRGDVSKKRSWPAVGERALIVLDLRPSLPWPMLSQHGLGYLPIVSLGGQDYVCGAWSEDLVGSVEVKDGPGEVGKCYQLSGLRAWTQAK